MSKKIFWLLTLLITYCFAGNAADTDTLKAIQFLADLQVPQIKNTKKITTGIRTSLVQLSFAHQGKEKVVRFAFPEKASIVATGADVRSGKKGKIDWPFNWDTSSSYKLLIAIAADSASNVVLYSGYVFLPQPGKWKLIGTCKINGEHGYIRQPSFFMTAGKKRT